MVFVAIPLLPTPVLWDAEASWIGDLPRGTILQRHRSEVPSGSPYIAALSALRHAQREMEEFWRPIPRATPRRRFFGGLGGIAPRPDQSRDCRACRSSA